MNVPQWVTKRFAVAAHAITIEKDGGPYGLREEGLLGSALARPQNRFAYDEDVDLCDLAAPYAVGLSQAHAFVDGNKRVAFQVSLVFLKKNGLQLVVDQAEATLTFLSVATGAIAEDLAEGFRVHVEPTS